MSIGNTTGNMWKIVFFFKSEVKIFIHQPEVKWENGLGRMTTTNLNIIIVIQLIFDDNEIERRYGICNHIPCIIYSIIITK